MDAKQQQEDELMVLESAYMNEYKPISTDYPNIVVSLTFPTLPESVNHNLPPEYVFDVTLTAKLPAEYPDDLPELTLEGIGEHLGEEVNDALLKELLDIAWANRGMPMIYAVVSELTTKLEDLVTKIAKQKEEEELKQRQKEEEVAYQEYEAARVTVENFMEWKRVFDEEMRPIRLKAKHARLAQTEGKLTGKQMFLQDQLLGISDLALTEDTSAEVEAETDAKVVVDGVEVDESLFQDDIDLPDDSDDDDSDYKPDE